VQKPNLPFEESDALSLNYKDGSFDIVICNHGYEHVVEDEILLNEISRVLKKQGICFFTVGNRIRLIEPHYGLSFLSIIRRSFSHLYLKVIRRGDYYHEKHRTYWASKSRVRNFDWTDYKAEIVNDSAKHNAKYMLKQGTLKQGIAKFVCRYLCRACPIYIWVLQKNDE
jgi:SAM-dependent methyltransferase